MNRNTGQTYRPERYYIQKQHGIFVHERVVSALVWWINRLQWWRFDRMPDFRVLCHRNMRYDR